MKNYSPDSKFLKLPRNNFVTAVVVILLGLLIGKLMIIFDPFYVWFGGILLIVLVVCVLEAYWGGLLLIGSIFTFEVSTRDFVSRDIVSYNLTASEAIVAVLATAFFAVNAARKPKFTFPAVLLLLWMFLCSMIVSVLSFGEPGTVLARFVQFGEFGMVAFIMIQLFSNSLPWKAILIVLVIGGSALSLIVINATLSRSHIAKDITSLNSNSWGMVLDLITPLALAYGLTADKIQPGIKRWLWPLSILLLLGELATLSRGSYIGLTIGVAVVVIGLLKPSQWFKVALFAAGFLGLILLLVPEEAITNVSDTHTLTQYRATQWAVAIDQFLKHPLFGIGPGNLGLFKIYSGELEVNVSDPHNFVVRIACESGVVGLILVFGILILTARRMLLNIIQLKRINYQLTILNIGMLGGMIAYLVHTLFDVFWVRGSGMLFWIYVGLAYAAASIRSKPADKQTN